jgi:integrase
MFAHHNPMEDFVLHRRATYRQKTPKATWRAIPDEAAEKLFSVLRCHRDRALVSFWLSSGARASELLGLHHGDLDVGADTITVVSKGSRAREAIPASVDSFVWLALYLAEQRPPLIEGGPVWWTRQGRPRPLTYHAARADGAAKAPVRATAHQPCSHGYRGSPRRRMRAGSPLLGGKARGCRKSLHQRSPHRRWLTSVTAPTIDGPAAEL